MFDGVHSGHASVIRRAKEIAEKIRGTTTVFTFSNHPLTILNPESAPLMIGSRSLRREIFEELGVEILIEIPFTKELSRKSPEEFLELLREKIFPRLRRHRSELHFRKVRQGQRANVVARM